MTTKSRTEFITFLALDAADVSETSARKWMTAAERTKLGALDADNVSETSARLWLTAAEREKLGATELLALSPEDRPGDNPNAFALTSAGEASGKTPLASAGVQAVAGLGDVFVVSGGTTTVFGRTPVAISRDRLNILARVQRMVNSADPNNHAVELVVAWLNKDKGLISTAVLVTEAALTVASGLVEVTAIISATAGDGVTVPPSGAVYAVAGVKFYGEDTETAIETLRVSVAVPTTSAAILTQPVARTLYVSAGGSDSNNGENLTSPVASIDKAIELAGNTSDPVAIWVHPGDYVTSGHIDVPDNVTGIVAATNTRSTKIRPSAGNAQKNVFRLGDGGYVEGFSFEGWQVDDLDDPSEGFAVSFRPGAVIRRTVFAFNITVYRPAPPVLIPPPLDRENGNPLVGHGPGVALADAKVASAYSPFPQLMLWGATPVAPNGIGYCAKNGAFLNGINAVALWMHKHYMALSGGEIILTNCASQFGDYSLWSEGSTQEVVPATTSVALSVQTAAANAVNAAASSIIDAMWSAMVGAGFGGVSEAATRNDAALFLLALEYDLRVGQQESARRFAKGLYDSTGEWVAPGTAKEAFEFSFEDMRDRVKALAGVNAAADAIVDGLVNDVIIPTLNTPVTRTKPSKITSVGHQWNNTMAGVNGRALDRPSLDVRESVIQRDLGEITFSGIDDLGKQYFSGGAIVNPLTGKLEGPPIGRTIDPRARRAAIIAGGQQ
jgi:hypothetical protein